MFKNGRAWYTILHLSAVNEKYLTRLWELNIKNTLHFILCLHLNLIYNRNFVIQVLNARAFPISSLEPDITKTLFRYLHINTF